MSKKSDNEKKSITKSFKISPDIAEKINSDARKKGMNFKVLWGQISNCIWCSSKSKSF